ncbi:MAG: YicC/YloC family endoribonuclease [Rikenellaceae bacterium]
MGIMSMTGYGKGTKEVDGKKIIVEIRSLNGKGLDLSVRMPSIFRSIEMDIRNIISKSLVRGKVEVSVNIESEAVKSETSIDKTMFKYYFEQLKAISTDIELNLNDQSIVASILKMPDVMQSTKLETNECLNNTLLETVNEAVVAINSFRAQEGKVMIADLLERISLIEEYKNQVAQYEGERVETVKTRIIDGLNSLNIEYDSSRLEQEMIFYIEKLDITEEKVRLQNHLNYFREVAKEENPGKKLGFICQEIGREINTTGSKSNHSEMQKIVVRMKDELEKIKEQSLNIL